MEFFFEDVVMLRDSSTIPQRTHHIQHKITHTLSNLNGVFAEHALAPQRKKERITHERLRLTTNP